MLHGGCSFSATGRNRSIPCTHTQLPDRLRGRVVSIAMPTPSRLILKLSSADPECSISLIADDVQCGVSAPPGTKGARSCAFFRCSGLSAGSPLQCSSWGGTYHGLVSFPKKDTWTAVVALTFRGQARAVLFKLGVIDPRSRLGLLAGFAVVNVGVIVVAAARKRTRLFQHNRPAHLPSGAASRPPQSS
jgi:hypothetical protein